MAKAKTKSNKRNRMAFDAKKFRKKEFEARTSTVLVPALAEFFEGQEPTIRVRGLSLSEFLRAKNAAVSNKDIDAIISALTSDVGKVEAIKEVIGIVSTNIPAELPTRLEMFIIGCVNPVFDLPTAILISDRFPIDFWQITQRIMELTGLGMQPKKLSPS